MPADEDQTFVLSVSSLSALKRVYLVTKFVQLELQAFSCV